MPPPRQRFDAHDAAGFQINNWVIAQVHRIAADSASEILLKQRARTNVRVHFWIEETTIEMQVSGAIERDARAPEYFPCLLLLVCYLRDSETTCLVMPICTGFFMASATLSAMRGAWTTTSPGINIANSSSPVRAKNPWVSISWRSLAAICDSATSPYTLLIA